MRVIGIPLLAAASIALPTSASAATDGIIVDPNTPSGKEYAIPLDQAIQEQGGTRATSSGEPSSLALFAPLFGRGISPSLPGNGGGNGGDGGAGDGKTLAAATATPADKVPRVLGDPITAAAAGREQGSSVSIQVTLGIPLVALLAAGALLLFVRRRNRPR